MAIFVAAEEGDIVGLTNEVKEESMEFVGAADIDDAIVIEDVCDPGNIVEDSIGVGLVECVIIDVAKDEAVFKLETDGSAVAKDETEFNPDTVGKFVPLAVSVIVEQRVVNGEEEELIVNVPIVVSV